MRLILASASPRRHQLLREAGYDFLMHHPDIDEETPAKSHLPIPLAAVLSAAKASAVSARFPNDVTLAADTVVAFGDLPLGKAADESHAREMLNLLSGTTHIVITAVTVHSPSQNLQLTQTVMSAVQMRRLTEKEITRYLATDAWKGKAGAYGIQDHDPLVTCITGSHTNVIGLPLTQTKSLLAQAGITPKP